jgi:hypothetical protein
VQNKELGKIKLVWKNCFTGELIDGVVPVMRVVPAEFTAKGWREIPAGDAFWSDGELAVVARVSPAGAIAGCFWPSWPAES